MDKSQLYVFADPVCNIQSLESKIDEISTTENQLQAEFEKLATEI